MPQNDLEARNNGPNHFDNFETAQALQSQANHGRPARSGDSQNCIKVSVQGYYNGIYLQ